MDASLVLSLLGLYPPMVGFIEAIRLCFGMQQVVINFFSGLSILMERTIKLGHFITIDTVTGRVIDLNRPSIVIRDGDGTESLIPNSSITRGTLQNHTLSNPDFRVSFTLELASIENFIHARSIILGVLDVHPRVLNKQPKSVLTPASKKTVSLWRSACGSTTWTKGVSL